MASIHSGSIDEDDLLAAAASLERSSEHPLAAAIVEAALERDLGVVDTGEVVAVPGYGVSGRVNGRRLRVGRPEWAVESGVGVWDELGVAMAAADGRGESVVVVMDDARVLGAIGLADKVRDTARTAMTRLRAMDVVPVMITGDAAAVAASVAADLGIDHYHARVLPADKAGIVRDLKVEGATAFVGDGINDAPALLEADLGIAIGAGTNVAIESADLVLVDDDPVDVARALALSLATHRKMMQNLAWATGYNIVAIPLAAGVAAWVGILLNPALGALLMSVSTVIVAFNAMLLGRERLD